MIANILLVADRRGLAASGSLQEAFAVEVVAVDRLAPGVYDGFPVVVFDVDLRNLGNVRRIRDSLPAGDEATCRIFAIDPHVRVARVHANVLGASGVVTRPLKIAAIKQCLRHHFRAASGAERASGAEAQWVHSVSAAASSLDSLFANLNSGGTVDDHAVGAAGEQIIEAIAEGGIAGWLDTVRLHHKSTFQHCLLVTGVATAFSQRLGMRHEDVAILTTAGLLHDIGKAKIPLDLLDKPGALTPDETGIVQRHPRIGYDYLTDQRNLRRAVLDAVLHHHEYLDGSGYPDGLFGNAIKDVTRILTICDIYGALLERRAYKPPRTPADAVMVLEAMARTGKLEAALVKAFSETML